MELGVDIFVVTSWASEYWMSSDERGRNKEL